MAVSRCQAVFTLIFTIGVFCGAGLSFAGQDQKNLQLDVIINGTPTNIIGSFVLLPDSRIGTTQNELTEIGLRIGLRRSPGEMVILDDIPNLKYAYDERTQKISFSVDNALRQGHTFDLSAEANRRSEAAQSAWGALLNYDLLTTTGGARNFYPLAFEGTSFSFDGRLFSPYGTFEQSAIARWTQNHYSNVVRLDTSYRYSDQERMITYRVGDAINGGLPWSRAIRIGGLQAQSNFALRPDLITMPLPMLGGTAAVPSTVDVYVNNIRTFSQDVSAGPFSIKNMPLTSGAGNAELVIRDSSGHETRSTVPFYGSSSLLAPGFSSWSFDAGFPRLSFGSGNDIYAQSPVGSATLRRGILDWMTVEGHIEGGAGISNGGAGAVVKIGNIGIAAGAISGSIGSGSSGIQTYLSYETQLFGFNINASSQHAFRSYDDLASATARLQAISISDVQNIYGLFGYLPSQYLNDLSTNLIYRNARPPRAVDRVTVSAPLPFDSRASVSTSFLHVLDASGNLSNILSTSFSTALPYSASLYVSTFQDFGTKRNTGVIVGLTIPLSDSVSTSSAISSGNGGTTASVDINRPLAPQPGSYGWRVRDAEGASSYREASASYRSSYGTVEVGAAEDRNNSHGLAKLRGSIATMGGGVFFSNWIDDGFAVVKTGAPGVEVAHENRMAGVTDAQGMLLVPTLRSYQRNKITIDPSKLPVDAEVERTRATVAPADGSGVLVDFKVRNDHTSALVTFMRPDGNFVPPGAVGRIEGSSEFVVGYEGQAFIKDLRNTNLAVIEFIDGTCKANFQFKPRPGSQVRIGPIPCR